VTAPRGGASAAAADVAPTSVAGKVRRLLPYAARRWPTLAVILGLSTLWSFITALQPWPLKILVDFAISAEPAPPWLLGLFDRVALTVQPATLVIAAALASLALFALNSLLDVGLTWSWARAGQRMVFDLANDLFGRLQRLSLAFHGRRDVGDSLSRLTGDSYCVYTLTNALLIAPVQHLFTIVVVGVVAWNLDPLLTVLSLVLAPIMTISTIFFGGRLKARALQGREAEARLMSFVQQTLTAVPLVQAFSAEARNRHRFQSLANDAVEVSQRATLVQGSHGLVNGLIVTLGAAIVLFVGGQRVLTGAVSVGSLLVFLAYVQSLQGAVRGLHATYGSVKTAEASLDRVFEVLDAQEGVRDRPGAAPLHPPITGHVRLEHVTFGYEDGAPILHDIDLEAHPGETIALVGATGVGKSTLVSLIPRFFDPWTGRITIDGTDLRDIRLTSLRAHVALVLQEPFILPLTIADNIAYGRPTATRTDIIAAAEAANARPFIERLPNGFDTIVGERGSTLSGGERQRLSIARALLRDAPILILDEPTSALDSTTEALILDALDRLVRGRTTFVIAHRLSTIRRADHIIVLEHGRIAERGTHDQLMTQHGPYRKFHTLQEPVAAGTGRG
jgi:ATP-binding cassette, subfamily B, bacterial